MNPFKATNKYLSHYAEPETSQRPQLDRHYRYVTCIPACDEQFSLLQTLAALSQTKDARHASTIVVINARRHASQRVHRANQACAAALKDRARLSDERIALGCLDGMGIALVDRFSEGRRLPDQKGVGLARKIAIDLALAWIADGSIENRLIWSTDADVDVPYDYFHRPIAASAAFSACLFPFAHRAEGDDNQKQALRYYEAYLHYYVNGLSYAGSSYAFHTIGSIMCIQADAYAAVRGCPKRLAGEDFYLLNKLAKVGAIKRLSGAPIILAGRTSDRVPYGTGVAIARIQQMLAERRPYEVYNPAVFIALRSWIKVIEIAGSATDIETVRQALEQVPDPIGSILKSAVDHLNYLSPVERAINEVSGKVLRKRLVDWNDAFRTLKLIHALRDAGLKNVPADDVLKPFMSTRDE